MTKQIIPSISIPNNLQRRELVRKAMLQYEGYGKLMYLFHSPYIRKAIRDDIVWHSAIDCVNALSDSDNEPRRYWNDTKKRMLREDKQLSDFIGQLKFPSWEDGRNYKTDALTSGGLVILVFELHTETSNDVRHGIAERYNRWSPELHQQIIAELEREIGWAGTETKLLMAENYEEGDYDNPVQPPGTPK